MWTMLTFVERALSLHDYMHNYVQLKLVGRKPGKSYPEEPSF